MQADSLRMAVGQGSFVPGDLKANLHQIKEMAGQAIRDGAEMLVLPELALTGYTVGDSFADAAVRVDSPIIRQLLKVSERIALAVGFVEETADTRFYNTAMFAAHGRIWRLHRKVYLPTYGVFNERRYFAAGRTVRAFDTPFGRMAMLICADAWHPSLPYLAAHDGADILLVMAASPHNGVSEQLESHSAWERLTRTWALTMSYFVVFANHGGAEGDVAFNGRSHLVRPDGSLIAASTDDQPGMVMGDLEPAQLRSQRITLPFRRDDDLGFSVNEGRRLLAQQQHDAGAAPYPMVERAEDHSVAARIVRSDEWDAAPSRHAAMGGV